MITRRQATWLIPLLLLFTFPLWKIPLISFLAPPDIPEQPPQQVSGIQYTFSMDTVTIKQAENGRETADIKGTAAKSTQVPNQFVLNNINGKILNDNGNATDIKAARGIYNQNKTELTLEGNVHITNTAEKYTLTTELVVYDGKNRIIHSPKHSVLTGDGYSVKGNSFQHNMKEGTYNVTGKVRCTIEGKLK